MDRVLYKYNTVYYNRMITLISDCHHLWQSSDYYMNHNTKQGKKIRIAQHMLNLAVAAQTPISDIYHFRGNTSKY